MPDGPKSLPEEEALEDELQDEPTRNLFEDVRLLDANIRNAFNRPSYDASDPRSRAYRDAVVAKAKETRRQARNGRP